MPAQASVTLGQVNAPNDACGSSSQVLLQAATGAGNYQYTGQTPGVIVSWSYTAHGTPPNLRLRIYHATANPQDWFARSESAQKTAGSGAGQVHANQLNTFSESPGIPILNGDVLGLSASGGGVSCFDNTTGATSSDVVAAKFPPDPPVGQNGTFPGSNASEKLSVSAVVEPDADGDGFGDETQDSCPHDATLHAGPCPVDVSIVKTASPNPKVGSNLVYGLSVKNNNTTNPATDVTIVDPLPSGVTFVSATPAQGSCSGTTTVTCALGTLAPGQTTTAAIVVQPTSAGSLSNAASVTTSANDTDTTNNSSSVLVNVAPATPAIANFKLAPKSFKAKSGTQVSYTLNTGATTKFSVLKATRGIKSGKRCVKVPKHPPKGAKKCTRYVSIGSFKRTDTAGARSFHYNAKLNGKLLKPGSYRLKAVASNVSGASPAVTAGFKVK
jgi:uncharacterized repeat protein (TIGR01451 family)